MSAFQFTPNGIVPLGQVAPAPGDTAVSGGAALLAAVQRATEQHLQGQTVPSTRAVNPVAPQAARPIAGAPSPLTGKQLVANIKARIRELDKALAKMPAMQDERAYLQRLLDAVKAKPEPKHPVLRMANGTRT